jgi:hypothetical protein
MSSYWPTIFGKQAPPAPPAPPGCGGSRLIRIDTSFDGYYKQDDRINKISALLIGKHIYKRDTSSEPLTYIGILETVIEGDEEMDQMEMDQMKINNGNTIDLYPISTHSTQYYYKDCLKVKPVKNAGGKKLNRKGRKTKKNKKNNKKRRARGGSTKSGV